MKRKSAKDRLTKLNFYICLCLGSLALFSCSNTEPKVLGPEGFDATPSATDTADSFSLEFALRDTLNVAATNRNVAIQGRTSSDSADFTNFCSADGSTCTCSFFTETDTATAIAADTVTLNAELNVLTCTVPASIADADLDTIAFARITNTTGTFASGFIRVKSQLTLEETTRGLATSSIRKVFRYDCTRTFLEGSGISSTQIACVNGMSLAFLRADYNFYLFQQVDLSQDNFSERGIDVAYEATGAGGTCGQVINRVTCGNNNTLRYGLAATANDVFRIAITLTSGPEPNGTQSFVGFAASTDSNLNCPPGLVQIRPFQAVPGTHTRESSNFVNTDGSLNNTLLEPATETIANFELLRQEAGGTCDAAGTCPPPSGGFSTEQNIAYDILNPVLCAIPLTLLQDI